MKHILEDGEGQACDADVAHKPFLLQLHQLWDCLLHDLQACRTHVYQPGMATCQMVTVSALKAKLGMASVNAVAGHELHMRSCRSLVEGCHRRLGAC